MGARPRNRLPGDRAPRLPNSPELVEFPVGTKLRILLVHENPLLAQEIANTLLQESDMTVSAIARTGTEAALLAQTEKTDVVLIDFRLSDMSGPKAVGLIRASAPKVAIVFLDVEDSETALLDAIDVGASAYLTKSASAHQLVEAIRRAANGEVLIPVALFAKAIARQRRVVADAGVSARLLAEFTPRELEVLHLLAKGLDTTDMAKHLGIANHTVEWHVSHLIKKLQVHSKLQAVVAAARLGLIRL